MTLRQLPGASVLGLVTALVAHGILFGGRHAWGGVYHDALLQLTFAAVIALTAATAALLWTGARYAADGTILAARLRELLPSWSAVAVFAVGWFAFGECLEAVHPGVPLLAIAVLLSACAWLIWRVALAALRVLAGFVFAIAFALEARRYVQPLEARFRTSPLRGYAQEDHFWCARLLRAPPMIANASAR